jgi:hypothetical protein
MGRAKRKPEKERGKEEKNRKIGLGPNLFGHPKPNGQFLYSHPIQFGPLTAHRPKAHAPQFNQFWVFTVHKPNPIWAPKNPKPN